MPEPKPPRAIPIAIATLFCLVLPSVGQAQVTLPGTQPDEHALLRPAQECYACHGETSMGQFDPYFSWQSGMMSQAARDPVFRAALAIANQDVPGVGEFCIRCHSPGGWLQGRSTPTDASALQGHDLDGVTCSVCHRLVDPESPLARKLVAELPPGSGNAMMVVDPDPKAIRGAYGDDRAARMRDHGAIKSEFLSSSRLCGTCHDTSNPLLADDPSKQPPHAYGHVERTYSEWAASAFSKRGANGTCQNCHMPLLEGGGFPSRFEKERRDRFASHGPVGVSTWVQDATWYLWNGEGMNRRALDWGKRRARAMLRSAAELTLEQSGESTIRLRITNRAGHKLPSGYPEGRRMWVAVRFLDAAGTLISERGRYGEKTDRLFDEEVTVPTLLDPQETRVYECVPGLSAAQAKKHGLPAGKSFHFVLNDVILKDNRIPPEGWDAAEAARRLAAPVAADYADGQNWDELEWEVPPGTRRVEVRLLHQAVTWEYIKFLAEENRTDDWGKRLYEAWTKTGRCAPETMAEIDLDLDG